MRFLFAKVNVNYIKTFECERYISVSFRSIISYVIETSQPIFPYLLGPWFHTWLKLLNLSFLIRKLNFAQNRENKDWVLTLNGMRWKSKTSFCTNCDLERFSKLNKHLQHDYYLATISIISIITVSQKMQRYMWLTIAEIRNRNALKIDPDHILLLITPQIKKPFKTNVTWGLTVPSP